MADSEQYRPAWPAVGAGVKRRSGWRVARAAAWTLLMALSAALPGCSQTATLPKPEASSDQDDFDRVVERLRQIIDDTSPAAAVPDGTQPSQRQVSASAITPAADGKPASATITILTLPAHVVEDAAADPTFSANPLVTGEPGIRFYAGAPIRYLGQRVGTLCVIDTEPRDLSPSLKQDLQDLAQWVESEIDSDLQSDAQRELISEVDRLREMALVDPLTRTWNRNGIQEIYNRELAYATRDKSCVGCIVIDIDHFKSVNDTHGHDMGDAVLKRVADRIRLSVRPYDSIGRMGGEEFLVLLPQSSRAVVSMVAERIRSSVESTPIELSDGATLAVTISLGTTFFQGSSELQPELKLLFKTADVALYEAKKSGRNRVVEAPEVVQSAVAKQDSAS